MDENLLRLLIKILVGLLFLLFAFVCSFFNTEDNFAPSIEYNKFDVKIQVNSDATFQVTEEISMTINGNFHGLRRDIPLTNRLCIALRFGTCGGFDVLFLDNVFDEKGNQINDKVRLYTYEDMIETYYRIEWELYPEGRNVTNYNVAWTIQYTVWGGIQWIDDLPRFYWNVLPQDRGGIVRSANIFFSLNDGIVLKKDNFEFIENYVEVSYNSSQALIQMSNLPDLENVTLAYTFQKDDLKRPGNLRLNVLKPYFGNYAKLNGYDIREFLNTDIILPANKTKIEVGHAGYQTEYIQLMPEVGESITKDVELKPELVMEVLIGINNFLWILTPLFIFIGAFGVYRTYRKNGLDKYRKNVIIPLFSPPINFHVALTNSIIKERFDNRDLSASIIKLAVEGYINIERKDNVLKLIRTDKPLESLKDEIDTIILTNFFSKSNEVNVTVPPIELRNSIKKIQAAIEKTVNQQGYFISNPRVQFAKYLAIGSVFTIFSGVLLIMAGITLTKLIGYISTFHLAIIPLVYGIGILLISKHMPSKSEEGSRIEAELLGFKMYLFTAERFRLEDQKIHEFEQYLAYAIALGVEKAWADRFADLGDKIVIDWYQGDPFTISEVYLLRKSLDISFRRILDYSSQSSVKASGWSSGTSFGGFSGGGGGGGRSGAW